MIETIRTKMAAIARLMFALMLLQCVFVAVEIGTNVVPVAGDSHHGGDSRHGDSHSGEAAAVVDLGVDRHGHDDAAGTAPDDCDNCCHCQGHGSHVALPTKHFTLTPRAASSALHAGHSIFPSLPISSIDRPPIV